MIWNILQGMALTLFPTLTHQPLKPISKHGQRAKLPILFGHGAMITVTMFTGEVGTAMMVISGQ